MIPGSGRSPGEGNGSPLQYSCLKNSMDRGAWKATVHGVKKSWTRLSNYTFTFKPLKDQTLTMTAWCFPHPSSSFQILRLTLLLSQKVNLVRIKHLDLICSPSPGRREKSGSRAESGFYLRMVMIIGVNFFFLKQGCRSYIKPVSQNKSFILL